MSAALDLWKRIGAPICFGRDEEIYAIAERAQTPFALVELVAPIASGKTSLLKHVALRHRQTSGGAIEFFSGSDSFCFSLSGAVDAIAERFAAEGGHHLLIIDGADPLDASDLSEGINRLSTGPWTFSTVIGSQRGKGLGEVVTIQPFEGVALKDAIENAMQTPLDGAALELLWSATCGNAELARELSARWRRLRRRDPEALIRLIEPLATSRLVDRDGQPLRAGKSVRSHALVDVQVLSRALIERIARDPQQVFSMPSHEFEQLVADLLAAQGYQVSMTQRTRDGGKDIYAARHESLGSFRYLVECKRHAPARPVGVEPVRALYGVTCQERVNAGILMTTSYFSAPAQGFADGARHQLQLKDYFDLRAWLSETERV